MGLYTSIKALQYCFFQQIVLITFIVFFIIFRNCQANLLSSDLKKLLHQFTLHIMYNLFDIAWKKPRSNITCEEHSWAKGED